MKYIQDLNRQNDDGIEKDLYDVVIVDSSDPVGPATSLFEADFYRLLYNVLEDDGLMACQSESPVFYAKTMKNTYDRLSAIFPITRLYTTTVPTYPGGIWSFTIASKKYAHVNPSKFDKETICVNKEILESCFAIPEFVKKILDTQTQC